MEKIINILKKNGNLNYRNVTYFKQQRTIIEKQLNKYGLKHKLNDDKDFFDYEIIYQSLLNKEEFEKHYEDLRQRLFDIWQYFEYNERKQCIDDEMLKAKANTKHFTTKKDQVIRIAFFDELLNALYENQMIVFDLPQYYKLQKSFNDIMIDVNHYKEAPYKAGFSSSIFLASNKDSYIIFNLNTKSVYQVSLGSKVIKWQFDRFKDPRHFTKERLLEVAKAILSDDVDLLINTLISTNLCNKYVEAKLHNHIKLLHKKEK